MTHIREAIYLVFTELRKIPWIPQEFLTDDGNPEFAEEIISIEGIISKSNSKFVMPVLYGTGIVGNIFNIVVVSPEGMTSKVTVK